MIESEIGLSYSFHLGNDKNKTKKPDNQQKLIQVILLLLVIMPFKILNSLAK